MNFPDQFVPKADKRGHGCSWRWHFAPGVLGEVMTGLDKLAASHPKRWVYLSTRKDNKLRAVESIPTRYFSAGKIWCPVCRGTPADGKACCNVKLTWPPYGASAIEKALADLEDLTLIAGLTGAPRVGHRLRYRGYIVLDHSEACGIVGEDCVCHVPNAWLGFGAVTLKKDRGRRRKFHFR